jgi:voltage-gated potassium channel Kch
LRFLKVNLMQKIWLLLLDKDFMTAYVHGIRIVCGDGITRQIFPRFFTYSADYPEK